MFYHKEKLYDFSDYMNSLELSASTVFNTEEQRREALNKICEINNFLERIMNDEIFNNSGRMGSQHKESY